jgi:hypothetical protein
LDDSTGWKGRIARLAVAALAEETSLSADDATTKAQSLFESDFPKVWSQIARTLEQTGSDAADIKLFDELLRYFVVFQTGNPAKAAKLLGMKDNALREFIYSREQKRSTAGDDA